MKKLKDKMKLKYLIHLSMQDLSYVWYFRWKMIVLIRLLRREK